MSYTFPLDYSKVQEFVRAVKANPEQHAGEDAVIPPTMLTSGRMIWEPQTNPVSPSSDSTVVASSTVRRSTSSTAHFHEPARS
ncbi:hypothetical protein ACH49M_14955 [Rhodococcus qingshengii]|uniref:hypothetical protein n=1 Tax=Rhodococcus qingshengii TaxID=334542 RepID=UPI0036FB7EAE